MPRSKNPAMVKETIGPRQQAFSSNILTDSSNMDTEYRFLRLLDMKRQMGIISEDDYKALTTSSHGSATEKASIQILKNLNRYSEFDPRLEQIFRVVGSTNKYNVSKILAERMVSAAATKRVLASTLGVTQGGLSSFGSTFVSEDIGRSAAALEGNPMTSARQRGLDLRASGVEAMDV
jgi:hypothetical protein